ncbi:MAG TPA: PorV/PorQ family protein [Candidatus Eisenbacteria bacterium]
MKAALRSLGARAGIGLALLLAAGPARAQTKTGTAIGDFLLIEPGARLTALGNAGVAAEPDLEAAYFNPAAAGRIDRITLQFSHVAWLAGINYDYVAGALPLGAWGTAFATLTALNSGEMLVRTVTQPLGTGERFTVSDVALGLGYSYAVSQRFAGGIQIRYLEETVWHSSAGALTFDVGTLYRLGANGLHLGSSITNFGTSAAFSGSDLRITYDQDPSRVGDNGTLPGERHVQDYPVPVLFRVGVGYPWRLRPDTRMWLALAAAHPSDDPESVSGGAEITWRDLVSLRAGYQNLLLTDSEEGLTAGAGFSRRVPGMRYRLDYAWADFGRLEGIHRFTLSLSF